jgi:hypothetical protein
MKLIKLKVVTRCIFFSNFIVISVEKARPNSLFKHVWNLGWKDVGYNNARFTETTNLDRMAGVIMMNTQFEQIVGEIIQKDKKNKQKQK